MKKIVLIVAFALLLVTTASAQKKVLSFPSSKFYTNEFFFSPFYVFNHSFEVGYQRNFKYGALSLMPVITMRASDNSTYSDDLSGFGLEGAYKFYFQHMPRKVNVYAGPFACYKWYEKKEYDYNTLGGLNTTYNVFSVGVLFGVHFMFGRFTMDLNCGGGVRMPKIEGYDTNIDSEDVFDLSYKGIIPKGNFTLGVAF